MKKRDIIFIGSILVVSLILFLIFSFTKKPGDYVIVRINGVEVATYSLENNNDYELNGGTNILRIQDGEAWLIDANCPDHLCVKQGKISKEGETITCLPNKLTITVVGKDGFVELES